MTEKVRSLREIRVQKILVPDFAKAITSGMLTVKNNSDKMCLD